ncbi:SIR2 family protein [Staphylococcus shinii]|uniref:SIR2 family protein n=1 Tax=Staphylococcus shinii TaxID=2912228 RepID=UPI003EEBABEA
MSSEAISISRFEKDILNELKNNNLNVFAGAGLSRGSGFVDWKGLLRDIAEEIGLDIDKEHDLVSVAQYYVNKNGRHSINEAIVNEFQQTAKRNKNLDILTRLPISTYWTTNYDSMIEDTLYSIGKIADVKKEKSQVKLYKPNRDAVVYKMHGDKDHPKDAVITRDDYESYSKKREPFITKLKGELLSNMFLFIGFSFEDPNLEQILSKIRVDLIEEQDSPKNHYCFFRKVSPKDDYYKLKNGEYDNESYQYDLIKQELKIKDLKRYGIQTVLIDDYEEITDILKRIEDKFKMNNVFISGSAEAYGDFTEEQASNLLHSLSAELVEKGYHITSGFGLGVGSYVINGALEMGNQKHLKTDDYLTLRPFPQKASGHKNLEELWKNYREDILDNNGITIFVFGNKLSDGKVVDAGGVMREFELAEERNLYIIPIGSTGYASKEILDIVSKDNDKYWYLQDSISFLKASTDNDALIREINTIIQKIQKRAI